MQGCVLHILCTLSIRQHHYHRLITSQNSEIVTLRSEIVTQKSENVTLISEIVTQKSEFVTLRSEEVTRLYVPKSEVVTLESEIVTFEVLVNLVCIYTFWHLDSLHESILHHHICRSCSL